MSDSAETPLMWRDQARVPRKTPQRHLSDTAETPPTWRDQARVPRKTPQGS